MKILRLLPLFAIISAAATLGATTNHTKGAAPANISQGEEINLADYLVPGKTTVFDFSSEYCGPCRTYTQPLAQLHAKRADVAVVRVDINRPGLKGIDWKSPVAREFHLESIPHFKVYGPDGNLIAEDGPEQYAARMLVDKWIQALGQ